MKDLKKKIELLRHTLGETEIDRNCFSTGCKSNNYELLEEMVKDGLMAKRDDPYEERHFVFYATELGKEIAYHKDEIDAVKELQDFKNKVKKILLYSNDIEEKLHELFEEQRNEELNGPGEQNME